MARWTSGRSTRWRARPPRAPFTELTDEVLHAVLDLLAGRYPSEEFSELRPRIVWDRVARARSGAGPARSAWRSPTPARSPTGGCSACSCPTVRGSASSTRRWSTSPARARPSCSARRPGGSRTSPTNASSSPPPPASPASCRSGTATAPAAPTSSAGRSGRSTARSCRAPSDDRDAEVARLRAEHDLDAWAADNLVGYLEEQVEVTGALPDDRTIVVERFRDELGDWRVCLLSPFGAQVHAPWAMAIERRLTAAGLDPEIMWTDDGIVLRLQEAGDLGWLVRTPAGPVHGAGAAAGPLPARRHLAARRSCSIDPDEVEGWSSSSSPAPRCSRPSSGRPPAGRCCCPSGCRASAPRCGSSASGPPNLLQVASATHLPDPARGDPRVPAGRVRPAGAAAAADRPAGPAGPARVGRDRLGVAVRAVAAVRLGRAVHVRVRRAAGRAPRRRAVARPRPAARAARRRRAARPARRRRARRARTRAAAPRGSPGAPTGSTGGPATPTSSTTCCASSATSPARSSPTSHADPSGVDRQLLDERRAIEVRVAGEERIAAAEDAARLRDAIGVALPPGLPQAFTDPVEDPLGDLVARYARTHGPFTAREPARRGWGPAGARRRDAALARAAGPRARGRVPTRRGHREWVDTEVLRRLKRRSLAALRAEVEPVDAARRSAGSCRCGSRSGPRRGHSAVAGLDALVETIGQLQGAPMPASVLEADVLPARLDGYRPADLDQLIAAGEVVWLGVEPLGAARRAGRAVLPRPGRPAASPNPSASHPTARSTTRCAPTSPPAARRSGRSCRRPPASPTRTSCWRPVGPGVGRRGHQRHLRAGAGAAQRGATRPGAAAVAAGPARAAQPARAAAGAGPLVADRRPARRHPSDTERAHALAEQLLERHGVLTREAMRAEAVDRRLQRRLPGPEGARGSRAGPPRLRRRRARSGPVRRPRRDRPAAGARPTNPTSHPRSSCSPRPIPPSPTAPRCRGRTSAGRPAGRPVPSWCWSTAPRRSTSNAAAAASPPSRTRPRPAVWLPALTELVTDGPAAQARDHQGRRRRRPRHAVVAATSLAAGFTAGVPRPHLPRLTAPFRSYGTSGDDAGRSTARAPAPMAGPRCAHPCRVRTPRVASGRLDVRSRPLTQGDNTMADSLVVQSKVKEAVKGQDLRMDSALPDALNEKIAAMLAGGRQARQGERPRHPASLRPVETPHQTSNHGSGRPPGGPSARPNPSSPGRRTPDRRRQPSARLRHRSYPGPMPEGDTIHRTAAALRRALVGRALTRVELPRAAAPLPAVGATRSTGSRPAASTC
jgi:hypothetical protein